MAIILRLCALRLLQDIIRYYHTPYSCIDLLCMLRGVVLGVLVVALFTVVFRGGEGPLGAAWSRLLHHCPEQQVRLGAGHGLCDEMQPWIPVVLST